MEMSYKEMREAIQKMEEIRGSINTLLVDMKQELNADLMKVELNRDLSTEGRIRQKDRVRKEHAKRFVERAKQLREAYDKAAIQAKIHAQKTLLEKQKEPHADEIALFEREFADLKMRLMLGNDAKENYRILESFIQKQNDPYFARKIVDEFPALVGNITEIAGNEKNVWKTKLYELYQKTSENGLTAEQREANNVLKTVDAEFGAPIFKGPIQLQAIQDAFGPRIARDINKPEQIKFDDVDEAAD
jgi:hypothetical protein